MAYNESRLRERHFNAARGYLALDLPGYALRAIDATVELGQPGYEYHHLRGEALMQQKEHASALHEFSLAQRIMPDQLEVLMGLAWCYKRTDQLPRSIEMMQRAQQTHPDEPIVFYNLACYHALAGDVDPALQALGRALRMRPALVNLVGDETDFDPIRDDDNFRLLMRLAQSPPP